MAHTEVKRGLALTLTQPALFGAANVAGVMGQEMGYLCDSGWGVPDVGGGGGCKWELGAGGDALEGMAPNWQPLDNALC